MRTLFLGAVFGFGLSGCATAAQTLGARALVTPFRMPVVATPALRHDDVRFVTDDGLTLRGWVFFADPTSGPERGTVVFLHGKDANRSHFVAQARRFTALGYRVLAYDQRAHGQSDGDFCTFGVREVPDLEGVLDHFAVKGKPVYLIGESMGAAVALEAAARDPRVEGVVAAAAFSDLRSIVTERVPFFVSEKTTDDAVALAERWAGFDIDEVSPMRDTQRITAPTLLVYGTQDAYVSTGHTYRIWANLTAPRQLVALDGVGHADVLQAEPAWQAIERWFRRVTGDQRGWPRGAAQ